MMEEIKIIYIDDSPELSLSRYIDCDYSCENYTINFSDLLFIPNDGYESLLQNSQVQTANIILIDSRLFENQTAASGKFSGEEFKFVLKKFYPFIEVIVVTQNGIEPNIDMIPKYDSLKDDCSANEYYSRILPPVLDRSIKNVKQYRLLAEKISDNSSWEDVLKDKMLSTLEGTNTYDELTKTDIDRLISAFKEIQESLDV